MGEAEWELQWVRVARAWAEEWAKRAGVMPGEWQACRRVLKQSSKPGEVIFDVVAYLLSLYAGHIEGQIVSFAGPPHVVRWLGQAVYAANSPQEVHAFWWKGGLPDATHRVAVRLWSLDPDDTLFQYDNALEAAQHVLADPHQVSV